MPSYAGGVLFLLGAMESDEGQGPASDLRLTP